MFSSKQLNEEQIALLHQWAADGATISDMQRRISEEFGHRITYMDTRFVILDLGITLITELKPEEKVVEAEPDDSMGDPATNPNDPTTVIVSRDEITIPGTMFSGKVRFSDGENGLWYVDDTGRLGLDPDTPGYRPQQSDIAAFQSELKKILR